MKNIKSLFLFAVFLLILLIFAIAYENKKTIIEVKNLCNQVEVGKKLNRDIFKNFYLYINDYEIKNQNYAKIGGSKSISCDIEVKNEIVISKTLSIR